VALCPGVEELQIMGRAIPSDDPSAQ